MHKHAFSTWAMFYWLVKKRGRVCAVAEILYICLCVSWILLITIGNGIKCLEWKLHCNLWTTLKKTYCSRWNWRTPNQPHLILELEQHNCNIYAQMHFTDKFFWFCSKILLRFIYHVCGKTIAAVNQQRNTEKNDIK